MRYVSNSCICETLHRFACVIQRWKDITRTKSKRICFSRMLLRVCYSCILLAVVIYQLSLVQMLHEKGITFDLAFTSVLQRAIKTLFYICEEMHLHWVPVIKDWHLNERNYGALTGLNKAETAAKHGEEQVKVT